MIMILTSIDQAKQAQWMTDQLLEKRLAQCIQQTSGLSTYHWQGKLECSQEYYLHIKTTSALKNEAVKWLEKNHPYETPEIIVLKGECSKDYSAWLSEEILKIQV